MVIVTANAGCTGTWGRMNVKYYLMLHSLSPLITVCLHVSVCVLYFILQQENSSEKHWTWVLIDVLRMITTMPATVTATSTLPSPSSSQATTFLIFFFFCFYKSYFTHRSVCAVWVLVLNFHAFLYCFFNCSQKRKERENIQMYLQTVKQTFATFL